MKKKIRVYVAASSEEIDRAATAMEWIREIPNAEVAHDWVAQIRDVGESNPKVEEVHRREWARAGLQRVQSSDVLWLILPHHPTIGAWVEFGAALATFSGLERGLILISGAERIRYRSIFTSLADEYFESHRDAANRIRLYAA